MITYYLDRSVSFWCSDKWSDLLNFIRFQLDWTNQMRYFIAHKQEICSFLKIVELRNHMVLIEKNWEELRRIENGFFFSLFGSISTVCEHFNPSSFTHIGIFREKCCEIILNSFVGENLNWFFFLISKNPVKQIGFVNRII